MRKRTYIDANLLIAACQGQADAGVKAMEILDDPERSLVVSDAVWLEVMPKPLYHKQRNEHAFYEEIFAHAEHIPWHVDTLYQAHELAQRYGIAAMDAIHVANAVSVRVDEFVSCEKSTKPMFRVCEISMCSLREVAQ